MSYCADECVGRANKIMKKVIFFCKNIKLVLHN